MFELTRSKNKDNSYIFKHEIFPFVIIVAKFCLFLKNLLGVNQIQKLE